MMASALRRVDLTILGLLLLAASPLVSSQSSYIGKRIGSLSRLQHLVKGEVYAVDSRTIHIKGFSYDGTAPDAFFYGGSRGVPSDDGFIIPDENGSTKPLGHYNNKDVTLTLPEGMTLKSVKWISIWCRAFAIDFGHVILPASLQYPRPQKINGLSTLDHGVTSDRIVVVDAQTFLIPNFHYDGSAPGGYKPSNKRKPTITTTPRPRSSSRLYSATTYRPRSYKMPSATTYRPPSYRNPFVTTTSRPSSSSNYFSGMYNSRTRDDDSDEDNRNDGRYKHPTRHRSSFSSSTRQKTDRNSNESVFGGSRNRASRFGGHKSNQNNERYSGRNNGNNNNSHASNGNNSNHRSSRFGSQNKKKSSQKNNSKSRENKGQLSARELALRHFHG